MSFCFYLKPSGDVPVGLLKKFDTEMEPIIFRRDLSFKKGEKAKVFLLKIVDVVKKIKKWLQIIIPLNMSEENNSGCRKIVGKRICLLYKSKFSHLKLPVHSHSYWNGQYVVTAI